MKRLFFFPLTIVLFALLFVSCDDDDITTPVRPISSKDELSAALADLINTTAVPGFAVSIVKNNTVLFQEAYGYADVAAQKPYTNQTVQPLASVSKTFVAAAVVKAIEQGFFTLDTDINSLLPVVVENPKYPGVPIKVKHLVTHTSGIIDIPGVYLAENYYILPGEDISGGPAQVLMNELGIEQRESRSLEEFLAEYLLEDGEVYSLDNFADAAPGMAWSYSNFGTGLMAYIIETVTGQSFDTYVKTEILQPLEMTSSTYNFTEVDRSQLAKWYLNKEEAFPFYGNDSYVEGNLYTSNEDLSNYLLAFTAAAKDQQGVLFSPNGYEMLFADQLPSGTVPADFADNHGVYWIKKDGKLQHGGNSFGVSTYLEIAADGSAGYSLMTNLDATFDQTDFAQVGPQIAALAQDFISAN